ncbi:BTB/POZ domain-containing protein At5g03250-like isoform X2 [Andrographis paniculata]|nr:BTB/POZ domain-containing protein At5g03250-like isoform X2 [Andrographis paniculata]
MTEEYGEGNLIALTETFLSEVFGNWIDTIKALETCDEVLPHAEKLHIVSRCIHSLAAKACGDPLLLNGSASGINETKSTTGDPSWNGISTGTKTQVSDDWWYDDVSFLSLPLYKRLIRAVEAGGMRPESIAGALVCYAEKYISQMTRQPNSKNPSSSSTVSITSEADQREILEEIVELLPNQKGVVSTRFLLRLLRTAMVLQASPSCRENVERRVGFQLDQASLEDLLIPNVCNSGETSYDIDCFQRILDQFMVMEQTSAAVSPSIVEDSHVMDGTRSLSSLTMVADLVDAYLAEVAADANMKFSKFQTLAAAVPDYARPISDGMYRALDIYLKAHPLLTDPEREQICRFMNCQKLSLEASTHAAQNERLPLRVVVQVLFFEQLRLRTSISGWFIASSNLDTSDNPSSVFTHSKNDGSHHRDRVTGMEDVRERVSELEKECQSMKEEFHKLVKTRRFWNIFFRRKSRHANSKSHSNGKMQQPHEKWL